MSEGAGRTRLCTLIFFVFHSPFICDKTLAMLNKIFLGLFVVALITMIVLSYLTNAQLQSIGFPPPTIVEHYEFYASLHRSALWISSLALLVIANAVMWKSRKSWALWLTFIYFGCFILLNTWWLEESAFRYKKTHQLLEGGFQVGGIFAVILTLVVGVGAYFDQFIIFRLWDKMYGKPVAADPPKEEPEAEATDEEK